MHISMQHTVIWEGEGREGEREGEGGRRRETGRE